MTTLGGRIKRYEEACHHHLTPRSPMMIRVDGRAFHTFTKGCDRPFDQAIVDAMVQATKRVAQDMQGFKLAYTQSDEATFLLTDYDTHQTMGWFDYDLSKVVSISASLFTAYFNLAYNGWATGPGPAIFDSRAFIIPVEDAPNAFVWRQRDWERNSLQMLARAHFSHGELQLQDHSAIHEMLHSRGINWAQLPNQLKNGTWITRAGDERHDKLNYNQVAELVAIEPEGDAL